MRFCRKLLASIATWGRQALTFVIYAALARLVGPESFGVLAMSMVFLSFTEIRLTLARER